MKKAFSYDIKERIAVISRNRDGSKTLELNRISYNDRPAKLDLRRWSREPGEEPNGDGMDAYMGKGITLSDEEAHELGRVLTLMQQNPHMEDWT